MKSVVIAATLLALCAVCAAFTMRWVTRRLEEAFAPPPLMPGMRVLIWVGLALAVIDVARKLVIPVLLAAIAFAVIA